MGTQHKRESRDADRAVVRGSSPADPARRARCGPSLLSFCQVYLAARFPLPFSKDHLRIIELLESTITHGDLFAVAMPRGSGKTTLCESAVLWALLYGHRRFIFAIAADAAAAYQIVGSIRAELEYNDEIGEDFPEVCTPVRALRGVARRAEGQAYEDGERTQLVWTKDEVRLPRDAAGGGSVVRSAGITGRVRGAKATLADGSQVRPDLVLLDDPQTDGSARSPAQSEQRLKTVRSTILGLAGPGQRIACLCACTVIVRGDLADRMLDRKAHPEWQGLACKLMNSMPKRMELWDQYADILRGDLAAELGGDRASAFYLSKRKLMDEGAEPAWAERFADGEVSAIQHAMNLRIIRGVEAFAAEYQNAPLDPTQSTDVEQITPAIVTRKVTVIPAGIVPDDSTELTAAVDIGTHVLWWSVAGWRPGLGGDVIAYGPYPDPGRSYVTAREMRGALGKAHPGPPDAMWGAALTDLCGRILDRDWPRADGGTMRVRMLLIDSGFGESTDAVFGFISRSPFRDRIMPSKGRGIRAGQATISEWTKKPGDRIGDEWRIAGARTRQCRTVMYDADHWKTAVAGRILSPAGSGSIGIYAGQHRMLSDHLSAEVRTRVTANGQTRDQWTLKPGQDNHLFDTLVMSAVAASTLGVASSTSEQKPIVNNPWAAFAGATSPETRTHRW